MRTGIFETSHFEVTHTLIRLFQLPAHQLTIFTYPSSWQQFQSMPDIDQDAHQWVIKKTGQSKAAFILDIYRKVKKEKIELLFLGTVTDNFIFYTWLIQALPNVRIILTIHDINSFFYYKGNGSLRRLVRNTGKKKLIEAAKEFTVINSTMVEYLQSLLPEGKIVRHIPGAFFDDKKFQPAGEPIYPFRLVVPGSVDNRRRDYQAVFDLLETCRQQQVEVDITLLGGFHPEYGQELLHKCRAYAATFNNLRWFEETVVPQPVFDQEMQSAHFVFAPCVIKTIISDGISEIYGISLSSGNIADIIRFAKPAIVPGTLVTGTDIAHVAIRYASVKEIPEQLMLLRDHPEKYLLLQQQALTASQAFTLEKIRAKYPGLLGG